MASLNIKTFATLSLLALHLGYSAPSAANSNSLSISAPTRMIYAGSANNKQESTTSELSELEKEELKEKNKIIIALVIASFAGIGGLGFYLDRKTRKEREAKQSEPAPPTVSDNDSLSM